MNYNQKRSAFHKLTTEYRNISRLKASLLVFGATLFILVVLLMIIVVGFVRDKLDGRD